MSLQQIAIIYDLSLGYVILAKETGITEKIQAKENLDILFFT